MGHVIFPTELVSPSDSHGSKRLGCPSKKEPANSGRLAGSCGVWADTRLFPGSAQPVTEQERAGSWGLALSAQPGTVQRAPGGLPKLLSQALQGLHSSGWLFLPRPLQSQLQGLVSCPSPSPSTHTSLTCKAPAPLIPSCSQLPRRTQATR